MLPLIPALFLLLLNGPSGLDKLAHDAHLPEAIRALHRQIESERDPHALKGLKQDLVIASLLASANGELSQALAELLLLVAEPAPVKEAPPDVGVEPRQTSQQPPLERLSDGYLASRRSRDGPRIR